jgi:hypothetical protein
VVKKKIDSNRILFPIFISLSVILTAVACGTKDSNSDLSSKPESSTDQDTAKDTAKDTGQDTAKDSAKDLNYKRNLLQIDCTPNLPEPMVHSNPGATPHHSIVGVEHQKWNASLNIANSRPLTQEKVLYRWGGAPYEDLRINRSPIFDLHPHANTINTPGGGMMAGVGMYAAESPFEYMSFSSSLEVYTVTLPHGMPTLDLSDREVQNDLTNRIPGNPISNHDVYSLGEGATKVVPPGFTFPSTVPAGTPIPAAVKYDWGGGVWFWVLKTPLGIKFERFTGKERSTSQLLEDIDRTSETYNVTTYYQKIKKTLSKRVYHPSQTEVFPTPLTAVYEVNDWKNQSELSHCTFPNKINTKDAVPLWRRDGSCGTYSTVGDALVKDNVDTALCEKDFPTRLCNHPTAGYRSYTGVLQYPTTTCRRVLKADLTVVIDPLATGCKSSDPVCR